MKPTREQKRMDQKTVSIVNTVFTDGALIDPGMTIEQMKDIITTQMHKMNIPESIIQHSLQTLPGFKKMA